MLSWIVWDPNRDAVALPLLGHSIGWYGILFALGFLCGYYLLFYFVRRFLISHPQFNISDVSWKHFLETMRCKEATMSCNLIRDIFFRLDRDTQKAVVRLPITGGIDTGIKMKVTDELNALLEDDEFFTRHSFPEGREDIKLVQFLKERLSGRTINLLRRRLFMEEIFSTGFIPLRKRTAVFCERLAVYVMVGTVIGARLGHVLFYEPLGALLKDPLMVFRTWEGGLASHGGVVGILVALCLFFWRCRKLYPMFNFVRLIDFLVVPSLCAAVFIRIGNFFNQEILGKVSTKPWAVVFLHPADGSLPVPRHPAQLYEAAFYLTAFAGFLWIWRRNMFSWKIGKISGLFFIVVFSFRFAIEFLKEVQSVHIPMGGNFMMGQYLSVPLIALGTLLLLGGRFTRFAFRNAHAKKG